MLKGSSLIPTAFAGEKYNTCRKSNASIPSLCTCCPAAENLPFLIVCLFFLLLLDFFLFNEPMGYLETST